MSNNTYEALLNHAQASQTTTGSALSNSVVLTDVSPGGNTAGQAFTFPAAYLQAAQQYRVRARGIISNTATPTLTLGVYYGGVAGVALATTGAVATVTGLSNSIWTLECDIRVESTGTSGSVRALGLVTGPFSAPTPIPASSSSGNLVTVNTSTSNLLTVGALWGTAAAANTLQVIMFSVEKLNEGGA